MRRVTRLAAALAAVVLAVTTAVADEQEAQDRERAGTVEPEWVDEHGNICRWIGEALARCTTPQGHVWYREDRPSAGSLLADPVKALMWIFRRDRTPERGSGERVDRGTAGP